MSVIDKTISVTELKARLSEHLRRVKAGESVLITERGRPIGVMNPLPEETLTADLGDLAAAGLVRLASGPLEIESAGESRPADPHGAVRAALLEERREGR